MANQKKYWKGLEELNESPAFIKARDKEFAKEMPIEEFLGREAITTSNTSRRDFLKYLGFTVAAASLAACESPVVKTIPYIIKPEEVTPGIDNWYASTFFNGEDYCSILIKTRDGRPIKIEGNKNSTVTKGAANARVQASVLSLYNNHRAKAPYAHGKESTWETVDKEIGDKLTAAAAKGEGAKGNIAILSSTIISPSTQEVIAKFIEKYPTAKHVTWDSVSFSGMRKANEMYFGKAALPSYSFDKANVIVSIAADFLTNWLAPIEFSKQYAQGRKVSEEKKDMSRHIQLESIMTVTGANADTRVQIKPSEEGTIAYSLYSAIAKLAGVSSGSAPSTAYDAVVSKMAAELWANKGKSLVVAGANDIAVQSVVNMINKTLGNYGSTINMEKNCNLRQGSDEEFAALVTDMKAGKIDVLITYGANPSYNASSALGFKDAYAKVPCKVSFAPYMNETAAESDYLCPDNNYLESWNDANPYTGSYSLAQPAIAPLFCKPRNEGTRCAQETLLKWAGSEVTDYYTFIQNYWKKNVLPEVSDEGGDYQFINVWNSTLQSGVIEKPVVVEKSDITEMSGPSISEVAGKLPAASKGGLEVVLYQKTGIGSGLQANNPWLQELPDPITKVTWDNYITMNPAEMKEKGFSMLEEDNHVASVATLKVNGTSIELPVFPQPGQARGTVGVAVGYGRTKAGKVAEGLGANVFPWVQWSNNTFQYYVTGAEITSANKTYEIGATQTHNTMIGRPIIKETTLEEWKKDPSSHNEEEKIKTIEGMKSFKDVNLWDDFDAKSPVNLTNNADNQGLRWKMAIDLNSCIGCGSCVVSCSAENNVPVVGKSEVILVREMHWIRIDRYYSTDLTLEQAKKDDMTLSNQQYGMMIPSADNPEIAFQPVMCQHCNHAPCETVCPVIATSHGSEGINQMVYNRCVGTKYCANNCPYKVRRFNWFNYYRDEKFLAVNPAQESNELGRMVLNPDVVVRSRGVMEKCSFCLQRIQGGKLKAKLESRPVKDGEITPACAQSCPTDALVFGNVNDPESKVAKLIKNERNYLLLADLDTQPNVFYMTKIRNKDKAILE
ncbi:MAG TPA: TAT-variant-translocated molybdopterin oxidoreductase [Bacteroidia bacterium]|jgi:MoCo/4Fe-4S cofactor protein with predicted Tat translocation signal|nr:TAT-variant-translocated molybdopterin oxidoreductase [Bacteroidia bacterium]